MGDQPDWSNVQANILFQGTLVQNQTTPSLDVSEYNAVIVSFGSADFTDVSSLYYTFRLADGTTVDRGLLSIDDPAGPGVFSLPVIGNRFTLSSLLVWTENVTIAGTTVPLNRRVLGGTYPVDAFSSTVANGTVSATLTRLLTTATDAVTLNQNCSAYNGGVQLTFRLPALAGATSWNLFAGYIDGGGTRIFALALSATAAGTLSVPYGHPFAYTSWWAQNVGVLTAAVAPSVTIFPSSPQ